MDLRIGKTVSSKLADTGVPLPTAAVQLYVPESPSTALDIVRNDESLSLDMEYRPPFSSSSLPALHVMVAVVLAAQYTVRVEFTIIITSSIGDDTIPGGAAHSIM